MTDRDLFLETAASIGRRIASQALWDGDVCTWMVTVADRTQAGPVTAIHKPADGGVYRGTAGTALFLTELHRLAPDPAVRRTAEGAVAHALAQPAVPRTAIGFHGGRVGTAYAAARAGQVFGRDDLLEAAARELAPLAENTSAEVALDVVAGAAGGIPILLRLAEVLDREVCTRLAAGLGETIEARAHVEPHGWAWGDMMQGKWARHLCGLAHGAAGMGHALMELYHAQGDARWRYGAEQAFAYERQFFDPAEQNWLDLRHPAARDSAEDRHGELLERLRARDPGLAYQPRFMCAWCHGSAGIALTRLRAWEVTGRAVYRAEAEAGLANTVRMLREDGDLLNHSLCHGISGNAVALLHGSRTLGDAELRAEAERLGAEGAERYERAGVSWPCGTFGGEADAGLMLGESGIGYFHLQLFSDDVPSLLLPTAPGPAAAERTDSRPSAEARRLADARAYFDRIIRVLRVAAPADDLLAPEEDCVEHGTVAATYDALRRRIAAEADGGARARLEDAFGLERERYEMTLGITDFCEEYLAGMMRTEAAPVDWETAEFRLAPDVRMVETERDWDADDGAEGDAEDGAVHLLYRAQNRIHTRPLSTLAALVLREVQREPATADALAARMADALPSAPRDVLAARVRAQLEGLHRGRLVECAPAPVPA